MKMKRLKIRILTLNALAILSLQLGCSPSHFDPLKNVNQNGGSSLTGESGGVDENLLAAKFALTLQPTLRANCAGCHGASQNPRFAVADALTAVRTIQTAQLVNFTAPQSSRFVSQINSGHQGFTPALASQIQTEIQAWADAVRSPASPVAIADTEAPAVILGTPAENASISGMAVVLATATDNVAVTSVRLVVDGFDFGVADMVAPFSFTIDTLALTNGAHTIRARAADAAGNSSVSALVNVQVNNLNPDLTAPLVSVSAPLANATVSGVVTITATATDNVAVVGVQFTVNGVNAGTEDTAAPFSTSWNTTLIANGSYVISARARDGSGNVKTAANVSVTVNNIAVVNPQATYAFISANIMQPKCNGCHSGYATYTGLRSLTTPGNPGQSLLYTITNSGNMPKGGAKLSAGELKALSDWITAGALNN